MGDAAGLTINIILAIISLLAAGFAGWQAYEARKSRTDATDAADEAEKTSKRIAAALESSAKAQEALAKHASVGDWGPLEHVDGILHKTINTSGRVLTVNALSTNPDRAQPLVKARSSLPAIVVPGGTFRLLISPRLGLTVSDVILHWSDEDQNPGESVLSV